MVPVDPSISISNPLEKVNKIWATCNIYGSEDKKNHIILTIKKLVVTTYSRTYSFPVNTIQSISTGRKKYLLPLILGGIAGPLSLLGLYENIYPATFLMFLFFGSIFLIYYGIIGSAVLIIYSAGTEQFIFLKEISSPLTEFIRFANILIPQFGRIDGKFYLYTALSKKHHLQSLKDSSQINKKLKLPDIQLYTEVSLKEYIRNLPKEERLKMKIARIDPVKLLARIIPKKFKNGSYGLFTGQITGDSIDELLDIENFII